MTRLPGWMGALPNLTSLHAIEADLYEWPSEGFRSLQCLGILCGDVQAVCPSFTDNMNRKPMTDLICMVISIFRQLWSFTLMSGYSSLSLNCRTYCQA